jgi:dipeptidase E
MPQQLLLVSSSRCHPHGYLEHCESEIRQLFAAASEVLFVPYARPSGHSHDEYTDVARERFQQMGLSVRGVHEFADPRTAVAQAQGVFIGGGNTFVLLRDLYAHNLIPVLRERIAAGMPYMGTSAGSNMAGLSIGTSNDMPIVHPPSFEALGVVPFNLNPHYPSAPPDPNHKGETRDDRIAEFHVFNSQPVVALYEDGMLRVNGPDVQLIGQRHALLFRPGRDVERVVPGPIPSELFAVGTSTSASSIVD